MKSDKSRRQRPIQMCLWVNQEEADIIHSRMQSMQVINFSAFARKMLIDGYIVHLDLCDVKEMVSLLRYCSNNLNQIAKRANATCSIYKTDIEKIQGQLDEIWESARGILQSLSSIK